MAQVFRVHPSIGFARVGNSEEYNLAPETMAALPIPKDSNLKQHKNTLGGLPLRPDGVTTITSRDIRDKQGKLKRQAARFKIFCYDESECGTYPSGKGEEVTIGCKVDGKKVKDIIWTVHVANKKCNWYQLEADETLATYTLLQYQDRLTPPIRNIAIGEWPDDPLRIKKLTIDPGPRTICGTHNGDPINMGKEGDPTYVNENNKIKTLENYPKSFPEDSFDRLYEPDGRIDTLGQLQTDTEGRLHVIAAYGRATAWYPEGSTLPYPLDSAVDNDGWFDDAADGPVNAVILFDDDKEGNPVPPAKVAGAWVVSTDPGYAPQTLNAVSLWDDIYDTWVRKIDLEPGLYSDGQYNKKYKPDFAHHLNPFFQAAAVQRWNTNLPELAIDAHDAVGRIDENTIPGRSILASLRYIRNPNMLSQNEVGAPLMPLSLGDSGQSLLSASKTQYFFLEQWDADHFNKSKPNLLGDGEYLDKASLINCLGGRFSPGLDMTFNVRLPEMWETGKKVASHGPFRVRQKELKYSELPPENLPLLTLGFIPYRNKEGLEPGDNSKFMSSPWHTDYNSCATHTPSPNPPDNTTLYWSWPAQRPVAVNVATDTVQDEGDESRLPGQRWSLRGPGTNSHDYAKVGRYQNVEDILPNWSKIGTIIQRTQIEGLENQTAIDGLPTNTFLEVESKLCDDDMPFITQWPTNEQPGD